MEYSADRVFIACGNDCKTFVPYTFNTTGTKIKFLDTGSIFEFCGGASQVIADYMARRGTTLDYVLNVQELCTATTEEPDDGCECLVTVSHPCAKYVKYGTVNDSGINKIVDWLKQCNKSRAKQLKQANKIRHKSERGHDF